MDVRVAQFLGSTQPLIIVCYVLHRLASEPTSDSTGVDSDRTPFRTSKFYGASAGSTNAEEVWILIWKNNILRSPGHQLHHMFNFVQPVADTNLASLTQGRNHEIWKIRPRPGETATKISCSADKRL